MQKFALQSDFSTSLAQNNTISFLIEKIEKRQRDMTLLGVTGSGKTFMMANVIEKTNKPTLIIAPNKTLAAQLFAEMKGFFPDNAVEYFVSYYDYYQPESYLVKSDLYIDKESTINEQIEQMRHAATKSLIERRDVIVVCSVSCIYGIGSPDEYFNSLIIIEKNMEIIRENFIKNLIALLYERVKFDVTRGSFRVLGEEIEVFPPHTEDYYYRISFFDNTVETIAVINQKTNKREQYINSLKIFPNSHYITAKSKMKGIIEKIRVELKERIEFFESCNKLIEAQRIRERVSYDLEMLELTGTCKGIENYSRYLNNSSPGDPPPTLFDYLQQDGLLIIDESHVTIPQIGAMQKGDDARKNSLIDYGFRLPSAKDNRPLKFEEWDARRPQTMFVSATPGQFEFEVSKENVIEQIVRPTGLLDPVCCVRKTENQIDDVIAECRKNIENSERILITTLTKKMAEDLANYMNEVGFNVTYMHSDIETLERIEIIADLREKKIDILIGINLLREGLDIPECSLVIILDADKEGFLRSSRSLIQTIGRAARNSNGRVILYADNITNSMKIALDETTRRRQIQIEYNEKYNITPQTIKKSTLIGRTLYDKKIKDTHEYEKGENKKAYKNYLDKGKVNIDEDSELSIDEKILKIERQMKICAENLEFEKAIRLREEYKYLRRELKKCK